MNKIPSMLRSSVLSITVFICLLSLTPQAVNAQNTSLIQSLWNKIFKPKSQSKPKPKNDPEPPIKPHRTGSRPGKPLCLIPPNVPSQTRIIWNTKPFFLWKGDIEKIAVGIPNSKEYLETQIVTKTENVSYKGQVLEPGKTYRWSIFLSKLENVSPTMFVPFKVMEAAQRNLITADLMRLERLQKNKGADAESIALTKANYFAQKGLWSDALQQVYSVPNPSPQLSQMLEDLPNRLCNSSSVKGGGSRSR